MKIKDVGEIKLIERISKGIKLDASVIKGIGDDTAVMAWPGQATVAGKYLLYTCDMLVEDVHFTRQRTTPFQIGWKAMARNLSDIAAMGGVGRYAVVSIGVDPGKGLSFVDEVYKGIKAVCSKFKVNIVGGDMSRSKKTIIDISLIGEVEKRKLVTRSGAKKGDLILVTGSFGGSIKRKHLNFTPRIDEARQLVNNFRVNSMIDVTDGLVLDLSRILKASRMGARIHQSLIPVSEDAESFESAITDGEDFELLFTMGANEARRFFKTGFAKMKTPVTLIGEITGKRDGFTLVTDDAKEKNIKPIGYLHF
ncbi:MAG: thiamine-phosphate kinase [Candidatus Omnitrophica bacterium]|nr:thiamine-phosphate kinase [Candidatus Omnitrophota bacterium]